MRLSQAQRDLLTAEAQKRGLDPEALIAAAEEELAASDSQPQDKPPRADNQGKSEGTSKESAPAAAASDAKAKPNLYMYLLPFVTVNEVRTIWLELDPMAGPDGDENAARFAARMTASTPSTPSSGDGGGQ